MRQRWAAAARVVIALLAAFLLAVPAAAHAAKLNFDGSGRFDTWTFTGDGTETDELAVTLSLVGRATVVTLEVSADDDIVIGGCAPAPLPCGCTGNGSDTVSCPSFQELDVRGGDGNDTVTVVSDAVPTYRVFAFGEGGVDRLTGGASNDTLDAGAGNDTLVAGGDGNDVVRGGLGTDTGISGGDGTDTLSYNDGRTTGVTGSFSSGGGTDGDTFTTIEALEGSARADRLVGTSGANTILGGAGDDVLVGGVGADTLNGGSGADAVSYLDGRSGVVTATIGGANTDNDGYASIENLTGSPQGDTLTGDAAHNVLDGGEGNDVLRGAAGQDDLIGGDDEDTASYDERAVSAPVSASLTGGGPEGDRYVEIEDLRGGDGNDVLVGDAQQNRLDGGPGDDVLVGAGDDDDLIGGGGEDTASYEERATPVVATLDPIGPKPDGDAYDQIRDLRGGAGDDELTGDDGANVLEGGAGRDTLAGLGGIDRLRAGEGDDTVRAADGTPDVIECGDGSDSADVDVVDAFSACETVTGLPPVVIPLVVTVPDRDGDGFNEQLDCDDSNASIRPGTSEVPGNAVDENCDHATPDFPLLGSTISLFVEARKRSTRITELVIANIVAGGSVEVRCKPPRGKRKACPFKLVRRSFPAGRRKLSLAGVFKRRRLPVRTVVDIRVLGPGAYGKVRIEKIGRSKTTRRTLCIRPGAKKPGACPLS